MCELFTRIFLLVIRDLDICSGFEDSTLTLKTKTPFRLSDASPRTFSAVSFVSNFISSRLSSFRNHRYRDHDLISSRPLCNLLMLIRLCPLLFAVLSQRLQMNHKYRRHSCFREEFSQLEDGSHGFVGSFAECGLSHGWRWLVGDRQQDIYIYISHQTLSPSRHSSIETDERLDLARFLDFVIMARFL